jgi:hypothetical protein
VQDEASKDKDGLFETPNAPIENNYKSKGDGFWNLLSKKI